MPRLGRRLATREPSRFSAGAQKPRGFEDLRRAIVEICPFPHERCGSPPRPAPGTRPRGFLPVGCRFLQSLQGRVVQGLLVTVLADSDTARSSSSSCRGRCLGQPLEAKRISSALAIERGPAGSVKAGTGQRVRFVGRQRRELDRGPEAPALRGQEGCCQSRRRPAQRKRVERRSAQGAGTGARSARRRPRRPDAHHQAHGRAGHSRPGA